MSDDLPDNAANPANPVLEVPDVPHKSCLDKFRDPMFIWLLLVIASFVWFLVIILFFASIHRVQEGNVAVYYRGGALLDVTASPGFHFKLPLVTTYNEMQITLQTDEIKNVPCGTQGGVIITFDRIEVVNILDVDKVHGVVKQYTPDYDQPLIYNKVHHEINKFCSKHTIQEVYIDLFDKIDGHLKKALMKDLLDMAPGLKVQDVRVTKPRVPEAILKHYEEMEAEKTKFLAAAQHQKVVEKQAETDKKKAIIEAEKQAQVAAIQNQQIIAEMEMQKTKEKLVNEIHLAREQVLSDADHYKSIRLADADHYKAAKLAESNAKLLIPEYLELQRIQAIQKNNKIYYGNSIPKAFFHSADSGQQSEKLI